MQIETKISIPNHMLKTITKYTTAIIISKNIGAISNVRQLFDFFKVNLVLLCFFLKIYNL